MSVENIGQEFRLKIYKTQRNYFIEKIKEKKNTQKGLYDSKLY